MRVTGAVQGRYRCAHRARIPTRKGGYCPNRADSGDNQAALDVVDSAASITRKHQQWEAGTHSAEPEGVSRIIYKEKGGGGT